MSRSVVRLSICIVLISGLSLDTTPAQPADSSSGQLETYQHLERKWAQKEPLTVDELKRAVEQFWTLREQHPQTKDARQATIEVFRLLDTNGPVFVDRRNTPKRLMEKKYHQVGPNEPVKAQLLPYASHFSQPPITEWRRVAERSASRIVQQAALFHLARRHHWRNRYDRAEGLLDTLSSQYDVTNTHSRYGEELKEMRQEIQKLKVGSFPPSLQAPTLDGDTINTANVQSAVTILFFYGSTCGTCVQKYPTLNRLYEKYDRSHVRLIGIPFDATSSWTSKAEFPDFMEKYDIEWPQAWKKGVFERYNVRALGTTMLLNQEGRLVWLGRNGIIDAVPKLEDHVLSEAVASMVE